MKIADDGFVYVRRIKCRLLRNENGIDYLSPCFPGDKEILLTVPKKPVEKPTTKEKRKFKPI